MEIIFLYIGKKENITMAKNKLNNMLSFKEFTDYPDLTKKTKKTDIGGDVINENFYDKLAYSVESGKNLEENIQEFKRRMIKAATSGQVKNLEIDDDVYKYKVLDKVFKLDCGDKCEVSFKTPRQKDWKKFELPKELASEIAKAFDDIEY
jgi:hypothetical protein